MVQTPTKPNITYPESDGKPMADNTKQFYWIVKIKENLELLYSSDPNVFVAGDLLWYPIEGESKTTSTAPDVMVIFGRPKGDRGSYKQWEEEGIAPQVVFEIRSPSNTETKLIKLMLFYEKHGVEEYYLYDPDTNDLTGLQFTENGINPIDEMDGWISPRLGIRFELTPETLEIYHPDGTRFSSYTEQAEETKRERERADRLANRLRELGVDPDEF